MPIGLMSMLMVKFLITSVRDILPLVQLHGQEVREAEETSISAYT